MVGICFSPCSSGVHSTLCGNVGIAASRDVSSAPLTGGGEGEEREEGGGI